MRVYTVWHAAAPPPSRRPGSSSRPGFKLPACLPLSLHVVEEFFAHDLAVVDFVDSNLFHGEPPLFGLKGDVQLERYREVRARDEWTFNFAGVDFVISGPPFALGHHSSKALRLARPSGRRAGFHADDIGRV